MDKKKVQFDFGDFACNTKVQETNNTITAFQCFWEVMHETFELHPQTIEMPRLYRFSLVLLCGWKYLNMRLDFFLSIEGLQAKQKMKPNMYGSRNWSPAIMRSKCTCRERGFYDQREYNK